MKDFVAFLLIIAFFVGLIWLLVQSDKLKDQKCKNNYGQEWHFSGGGYKDDLCVNKNGDIKGL
jgi:hypothetical protein